MTGRTVGQIDVSQCASEARAEESGECLFCAEIGPRIFLENDGAVAIRDAFPASELHTLVIPKRHAVTALDLSPEEAAACHELILRVCADIRRLDRSVSGFNIGANAGRDAGQSVFHCHYHVIPRRPQDSGSDLGGIRHAMPGRRIFPGDYL